MYEHVYAFRNINYNIRLNRFDHTTKHIVKALATKLHFINVVGNTIECIYGS